MTPGARARGISLLAVAAVLTACTATGSPAPTTSVSAEPSASAPASPGTTTATPASPGASAGPLASAPTHGAWAKLAIDGPAPEPREDHTWTLSADGRSAYLFGGRDARQVFGDLWRFDLDIGRWERIETSGAKPAARFGHEAVWAPGLGLVVWAGQAGPTAFFDDLWHFDPANGRWAPLQSGGLAPVARYGSCSGIGPDGRLWISHGFTEDGVRFADTRAYDFVAATWSDQAPSGDGPVQRCLHACWWEGNGTFALYAGQTTGTPALGDLWLLTPGSGGAPTNRWSELPSAQPAARQLAAVGRRDGLTVVFGGAGLDRKPLADTWLRLDGDGVPFHALVTDRAPGPRSGAALVDDVGQDRLLLFGGTGSETFGDLWSLTLGG